MTEKLQNIEGQSDTQQKQQDSDESQITNGWSVYAKKVLSDIDYLIERYKDLYEKYENLRVEQAVMKVKISLLAIGASVVSSAIVTGIATHFIA